MLLHAGGKVTPELRAGPHALRPGLLADVLSGEDLPAGFALEAAQMPLLVQRQQCLPVLNVPSTASTVWKRTAAHSYSHSPRKIQGEQSLRPRCSPISQALCPQVRFRFSV